MISRLDSSDNLLRMKKREANLKQLWKKIFLGWISRIICFSKIMEANLKQILTKNISRLIFRTICFS